MQKSIKIFTILATIISIISALIGVIFIDCVSLNFVNESSPVCSGSNSSIIYGQLGFKPHIIVCNNINTLPKENKTEVYILEHGQLARLSFNPTEKMKVDETEIINAYIAYNLSNNVSKEYGLKETLQSKDINITPIVKVTLIGEESGAFKIDTIPPNSDGVQPIVGERTTIWSWQVTPLKSGKHKLLLSVDYVIPLNSDETSDYQHYKTLKNI